MSLQNVTYSFLFSWMPIYIYKNQYNPHTSYIDKITDIRIYNMIGWGKHKNIKSI